MATSLPRDNNHVPALLGTSTDGTTTVLVLANSSTHALKVSDGTTGSDNGPKNAPRYDHVPAVMGVSSVDGVTPVVIYTDSSGNLLVQSS